MWGEDCGSTLCFLMTSFFRDITTVSPHTTAAAHVFRSISARLYGTILWYGSILFYEVSLEL